MSPFPTPDPIGDRRPALKENIKDIYNIGEAYAVSAEALACHLPSTPLWLSVREDGCACDIARVASMLRVRVKATLTRQLRPRCRPLGAANVGGLPLPHLSPHCILRFPLSALLLLRLPGSRKGTTARDSARFRSISFLPTLSCALALVCDGALPPSDFPFPLQFLFLSLVCDGALPPSDGHRVPASSLL